MLERGGLRRAGHLSGAGGCVWVRGPGWQGETLGPGHAPMEDGVGAYVVTLPGIERALA